jgi:hypothetical protein
MYYTAKIYDPAIGLDQIFAAASKFNAERFLYALEYKNWDEEKLELMGNEVATYRRKLENEHNRLVEFAEVFNKEFATMNNKCFSSALTMLRKLRSGISETKKLFMKFCPRARQETITQTILNNPVSAYNYAYISADVYQLPLFKFEGYPSCVSGLYNEMEKFFLLLMRCIQLCKQVLNEERKIKSDNKYCKYLFDEFKHTILREIADIIMMIARDSDYLSEEKNPAIASRNHYDNDEAWAPIGFHNYSKTEVKQLIIKQVLDEEEGNDLTRMEKLLFGNDEVKVHKYRYIIMHFDELIPDSYHRKNLPAKYIQMFFQFIGIPSGLESDAVEYFNEMYLSSSGRKFETVTYQAINSYKKEILEDKNGAYKDFIKRIKQHFYNVVPLQKAIDF